VAIQLGAYQQHRELFPLPVAKKPQTEERFFYICYFFLALFDYFFASLLSNLFVQQNNGNFEYYQVKKRKQLGK
jgi:hypothetical protein